MSQEKSAITPDPLIGQTLGGRYQITKRLGRGGMGAVYQARHLALDKFVAVKIVHGDLLYDDKIVQRFKREVTALSHLAHPNLISIQDVGETSEGAPYFVMEFLDCIDFGEFLKREVFLPPERAVPIFLQIADALAHAHEKGIVHRDLKPANILVIESENRDFIKVVDLGIAKLLGPEDDDGQKLTRTGEAFGSPLYMSPEQVMGRAQDARTDIYALGCLMFEALTSVPPMIKETAIAIMGAHVQEEPPTFNQAMPELPVSPELKHLESICLRCMKKNPGDRFQTMRDLIKAIGGGIAMDSGKYAISGGNAGQHASTMKWEAESRIGSAQQSNANTAYDQTVRTDFLKLQPAALETCQLQPVAKTTVPSGIQSAAPQESQQARQDYQRLNLPPTVPTGQKDMLVPTEQKDIFANPLLLFLLLAGIIVFFIFMVCIALMLLKAGSS